jgi:hypothetical protein
MKLLEDTALARRVDEDITVSDMTTIACFYYKVN